MKRPKIAIMSATEAVSDSVPSSVDAQLLTEMGAAGEFGEAEVFGPLALDCALVESAAQAKGIERTWRVMRTAWWFPMSRPATYSENP